MQVEEQQKEQDQAAKEKQGLSTADRIQAQQDAGNGDAEEDSVKKIARLQDEVDKKKEEAHLKSLSLAVRHVQCIDLQLGKRREPRCRDVTEEIDNGSAITG
jgi:hypothetical protein